MTELEAHIREDVWLCIKVDSKKLHLPDSQFFNLCNSLFGVNKGIYNTIDNWFYEKNYDDIVTRRRYIITFLSYVISYEVNRNHHCSLRFGNGGLVQKLREFTTSLYI